MKESRPKAEPASVDAGEKSRDSTEFYDILPEENQEEEEDEDEDEEDGDFTPSLYRLVHTCLCTWIFRDPLIRSTLFSTHNDLFCIIRNNSPIY